MPRSDKERSRPAPALPGRVERALAQARRAATVDRKRKGGRWLAVIPVSVAVLMMLLMMPRATEPHAVPLPYVDERALAAVEREDDARADRAERQRLPSDVLGVGSALRAANTSSAEVGRSEDDDAYKSRLRIDDAMRNVWGREGAVEDLLALRAVQTRRFLTELARFEATGEASEELVAIAGAFLERIRDAGWAPGRRVLLTESQRRAAYKSMWNALAGVDRAEPFKPTLDEQRVLYLLYLQRPHPPESRRLDLVAQRKAAKTDDECARALAEERRTTELWRADKIKALGALDPSYPTAYALGVAYYRAGSYDLSVEAFRAYLDAHEDGPLALRARNHLKAALAAHGTM